MSLRSDGGVRIEAMDGQVAQAILCQSPDCIKILDHTGKLQFMSENGQRLMAIEDFAMVEGQYWWDLWPEASRDTLRQSVAAASKGVPNVFDAPCPTAANEPKMWRVRVSRIEGGPLDGRILASSQDITQTVATEEARRTLEGQNEALRHFTRLVAHDLRGPIRQHKLLAEIITETSAPGSEPTEAARQIAGSAASMLDLISGLEALHRDDKSTPIVTALGPLIEQAASLVGRGRFTFELVPAQSDVQVRIVPGQIVSVMTNLIENALRYHPQPQQCHLRVTVQNDDPAHVAVVVEDDGHGFAPDLIDQVFDPLVRQSNSLGKPGSGLGLAIVRKIMHAHGGTAEVLPPSDKPGHLPGARVLLTFPRHADH